MPYQAPSHQCRYGADPQPRHASFSLIPFPPTVSLGPSTFLYGKTTKPSAPSRPLPSGVTKEPQVPLQLPRTVDARGFPRKDPTCALCRVRMDACFDSLQMFPRLSPASATLRRGCLPTLAADVFPTANPSRAFPSAVDARAFARRYARNALPGLAKIAPANARSIAHVPAPDAPAYAVEGALALPSLILSWFKQRKDPLTNPTPTLHPHNRIHRGKTPEPISGAVPPLLVGATGRSPVGDRDYTALQFLK